MPLPSAKTTCLAKLSSFFLPIDIVSLWQYIPQISVHQYELLWQAAGDEGDNDMNTSSMQYPEGWYSEDDDGQLSWFNAGVRVGVGIGLGVCVGVGIGVGLLMRSYQATTRNLKRRFFWQCRKWYHYLRWPAYLRPICFPERKPMYSSFMCSV